MTRRMALAVALSLAGLAPALAQIPGGGVPPLEQVPYAPPPDRGGEVLVERGSTHRQPMAERRKGSAERFRGAYGARGRPRLAIYWNRELGDSLNEWYGDVRLVQRDSWQGSQGDGQAESVIESQRRATPNRRLQPSETWEWEFQDGFLAPFLSGGATVVDRATIIRMAGLQKPGASSWNVEAGALRGMADVLVEVLVAPSARSRVGYELHARMIETATGRILGSVNSRHMQGWGNDAGQIVAGEHGFTEMDEDSARIGPESGASYRAGEHGFTRGGRPPPLRAIAQTLAYNVMDGLSQAWGR
ncbi:MAG: hypothetical protein K2Q10_14780 [Rhodospirillales bacterium]|nr:hypothetical protein [Rhodospirillales bacterium]